MSIIETIRTALYGSPPSQAYQPSKEGVIDAFDQVVQSVTVLTGGVVGSTATIRATLALLTAVSPAENTLGLVYNDPTSANNGIYHRTSGAWVFTGLLGAGPEGPGPTNETITASTATAVEAAADAEAAAASATLSAAAVESLVGPVYVSTAAGLAATTSGDFFAVDVGDGTVSIYLDNAGVAVLQRRLATTEALAGDGGSALVGGKQSLVGAVLRSLADIFSDELSVMDFIPLVERVKIRLRTSTVDLSTYFAAASLAAGDYGSVNVPRGLYNVAAGTPVRQHQYWRGQNSIIKAMVDTQDIFVLDDIEGATIDSFLLLGTLVSAGVTAQNGIHVTNGRRNVIRNVRSELFKGYGFLGDGTVPPSVRSDASVFESCSAFECSFGRGLIERHEYTTWSNWNAGGNIVADYIIAGNTETIGGAIVDNVTAVQLRNGTNHGHGRYVGVSINHNATLLDAISITLGFKFVGCSFIEGNVIINDSSGIDIFGGDYDCTTTVTSGANSGVNRISHNYMPGDYSNAIGGTGVALLDFDGNWNRFGASLLNTPSRVSQWIKFHWDGTAMVIDGTNGCTVSRAAAGDYTVTWAKSFATDDYALSVALDTNASGHLGGYAVGSHDTNTVRIYTYGFDGTVMTQIDPRFVWVKAGF